MPVTRTVYMTRKEVNAIRLILGLPARRATDNHDHEPIIPARRGFAWPVVAA